MEKECTCTNARIGYIDLFRGIGILLMIMGHVGFGNGFSKFIHAFNMPMFFFSSGFFYKRCGSRSDYLVKRLRTLIIPYLGYALINAVCYVHIYGKHETRTWITHVLWDNTEKLPVAGALWFLTALFIADILYQLLSKWIDSYVILSIVIFVTALWGSCAKFILPCRMPWSLDAAFVGMGFYHLGRCFKNFSLLREKVLKMNLLFAICLGCICVINILWGNGFVNMRTATYSNVLMFWLNAIVAIVVGMNLSRILCENMKGIFQRIVGMFSYIGKNSLVFVALNQVVIVIFSIIISNRLLYYYRILCILICTMVTLCICNCIGDKFKITRMLNGKSRT